MVVSAGKMASRLNEAGAVVFNLYNCTDNLHMSRLEEDGQIELMIE